MFIHFQFKSDSISELGHYNQMHLQNGVLYPTNDYEMKPPFSTQVMCAPPRVNSI